MLWHFDSVRKNSFFAAWKRYSHEQSVAHLTDKHANELRVAKRALSEQLDVVDAKVKAMKGQNEELEAQLNQAAEYAEELERQRLAANTREAALRARLAEAEKCLKHLNRDGLSAMDGVRSEVLRYEKSSRKFKNVEEERNVHIPERKHGSVKLHNIKAQLDQIVSRLSVPDDQQSASSPAQVSRSIPDTYDAYGKSPDYLFESIDKNHDGVITREEFERFEQASAAAQIQAAAYPHQGGGASRTLGRAAVPGVPGS